MTRHPRLISLSSSDRFAETYPSIAHHSACPSERSSTTFWLWSSRSSRSSTSSPSLVTAVAWAMALLLVFSCLEMASAKSNIFVSASGLGKRSFFGVSCKGVYDRSIYARLDRICEDCYNLFREPQLHSLCRKNCFTSDYFKGCIDVLLLDDKIEEIKLWIKQLHGADPEI